MTWGSACVSHDVGLSPLCDVAIPGGQALHVGWGWGCSPCLVWGWESGPGAIRCEAAASVTHGMESLWESGLGENHTDTVTFVREPQLRLWNRGGGENKVGE